MEAEEKPITKKQSTANGIAAILWLIIYYGIALGIWGLALKKSFLWFGLSGVILGLIIGLFSAAPVIAMQKTQRSAREMMFATGAIWGNIGVIVGVLGIIFWIVRTIFF